MKLTLANIDGYRQELVTQRKELQSIMVCCGTGCRARNGLGVAEAMGEALEAAGLGDEVKVELTSTGCHGWCEQGPIVTIEPDGVFYTNVKPEHAGEIVAGFQSGHPVQKLLYRDLTTRERKVTYHEVPFYSHQTRWAMRNVGRISPTEIDHYIARDGYKALAKVLAGMSPAEVVDEVAKAGLRGRGGRWL